MAKLQLHMEDLEDWSQRNNVRISRLPEATAAENLHATVLGIFSQLLGDVPLQYRIFPPEEVDRDHRTLGPRSADPNSPRYVLVHRPFFIQASDASGPFFIRASDGGGHHD